MVKAKRTKRARKKAPDKTARKPSDRLSIATSNASQAGIEFSVAGIGASAGGFEALTHFIQAVPPNPGLAFLIVVHLDPSKQSNLAELLGNHAAVKVVEARNRGVIERDTVYVLPPNRNLTIRDGLIILTQPAPSREPRHPVDVLFRSLAAELGPRAIGIVLSGTGSNGSAGLRAIKAEGGLVMAQEPAGAGFSSMPDNAIATGLVDYVLDPDDMPAKLVEYASHPYVRDVSGQNIANASLDDLGRILAVIKVRDGRDFAHYKRGTLSRRIHRRMGLRQIEGLPQYLEYLRSNDDEVQQLAKDLLINVSGFFRDREPWKLLDRHVIKKLVAERKSGEEIRIWVPGCATGEEAYSLAMLLAERAEAAGKHFDVKIFATDTAADVIETGRTAVYPGSIDSDVSDERLRRFFEPHNDSYQLRKFIRDQVVFAPQNVLADPPFSHLDLISCRNLLIYFDADVQRKVIALFHFALRDNGYLFLGTAENVTGQEELFEPISAKHRIFRRVGPTRYDIEFPTRSGRSRHAPVVETPPPGRIMRNLTDRFRQVLAEQFAPASVLVDGKFRVLYFHGETDSFLSQPSGEPSRDLLTLLRSGLRSKVRQLVQRVFSSGKAAQGTARTLEGNESTPISINVTPMFSGGANEAMVLVSFDKKGSQKIQSVRARRRPDNDTDEELRSVRSELQSTIEELETSNEELKASNEEIISINEELQSTNEELETSKEELQSLNEELNTVNAQLQAKVEELERTTNNLSNLLTSTDIATIFLDRSFRIRWFTPPTTRLLDLMPTDVGRPLAHFAQKFKAGSLIDDAQKVLQTLTSTEDEVEAPDKRWYMRRILPYRTEDHRIEGVVITFTDITRRRAAEERQHILVSELRHRVRNVISTARSLAAESSRATLSEEDQQRFLVAFDTRVNALARVQTLIIEDDIDRINLENLVREELSAHSTEEGEKYAISGPAVALTAQAAQMIALAISELATNAIKYGALGRDGGKVELRWQLLGRAEGRRLQLEWKENGVGKVRPSGRRGMGMDLIEKALPYTLGGNATVVFQDDGLRCVIDVPAQGNISEP